jgi:hypothetical protein
MRRSRLPVVVTMFVFALAGCASESAGPVFERSPAAGTDTTVLSDQADTTSSEDTVSSETPDPLDAPTFELIASLEPIVPDPAATTADELLGGRPDRALAEALSGEISTAGVDLTGVELWVLPVTGTEGKLLVLEILDSAVGLVDDPGGDSVLDALVAAPSLDGSGITRIVMNYHGSDADGEFTLSATVDLASLIVGVTEGTDVGDAMELQFSRNGVVVDQ